LLANKSGIHAEVINPTCNDFTGASSPIICDIITHLRPYTLKLHNNKLQNLRNFSTAIVSTATVKVLDISYNKFASEDIIAISDTTCCLEELDISGNKLDDKSALKLSEGIQQTKTLKSLTAVSIDQLGAISIADGVKKNTSLKVLNMSNNEVSDDGAIQIASSIEVNQTLTELCISYNRISSQGAIAIAKSLAQNNSLKKLNISGNHIGQDSATEIAKAICKNRTLEELSFLGDDTEDDQSYMKILESLHRNNSLYKLHISKKLHVCSKIQDEIKSINEEREEKKCKQLEFYHLHTSETNWFRPILYAQKRTITELHVRI